jgi:acyl dehydratase
LLDVKIEWVLHGEEAYEFGAPICVGDTITASWKITDIFDKKGGAMQFIAVAVDMTNQLDDVVCVAKRLLIVRQPQ